jgi:hypothetical protein
MSTLFDIFRVHSEDKIIWLGAVTELETAKARVAALMQASPCEYLVLSQATGHKLSFKPTDDNGDLP